MKRLAVLLVVALVPGTAHAWDSECRKDPSVRSGTIAANICRAAISAGMASDCASGIEATHGALWGEHSYIVERAMTMAGLGAFTAPSDLVYYASGAPAGAYDSWDPTGAGARMKKIVRPLTIHELVQIPDWSYGMADYLAGNEHCLAAGAVTNRDDSAQVAACHDFASHMGAVNSTHFVPQAQAVYQLYHDIALKLAKRCKSTADAFPTSSKHPLAKHAQKTIVESCEREALSFEALGQHYLTDAWSTGHMWQRWGTPQFAALGTDARVIAQVTAMVAGMQHGARGVLAKYFPPVLISDAVAHDQMCTPGWYRAEDAPLERWVTWAYPSSPARFAGGGDLYLLGCMATQDNKWSLERSPELDYQSKRMFTCAARGFQEVYEAGPKSQGSVTGSPDLHPIATSTDERCWSQRVTDRAMYLGFGASWFGAAGRDPWVLSKIVPKLVNASAGVEVPEHIKLATKVNLARISSRLEWMAAEAGGVDGLDKTTTLADLADPTVARFLGLGRNAEYASEITGDKVGYLDARDPNAWSAAPGVPCEKDSECASDSYCVRVDQVLGKSACVRKEHAILQAFRPAEVVSWCQQETTSTIALAAKTCKANETKGPDACDACVELVLPHLRNAVDKASYDAAKTDPSVDRRSICDVLEDAKVYTPGKPRDTAVYAPYNPLDLESAKAAARCICGSGDFPDPTLPAPACGSLSTGNQFTCYAKPRAKSVLCWGNNAFLTLGDGATPPGAHRYSPGPVAVPVMPDPADTAKKRLIPTAFDQIVQVTAGARHACALDASRHVFCWGDDLYRQAGRGYDYCNSTPGPECYATRPQRVQHDWLLPYESARFLGRGLYHTCARPSSSLACWGRNDGGQLGNPTLTGGANRYQPTPIDFSGWSSSGEAVSAAGGNVHTCMVTADGSVWCWGDGTYGQLGDGRSGAGTSAPTPIKAFADAVEVAAGQTHSCARKKDGSVWCWGRNDDGQIGNGLVGGAVATPTKVLLDKTTGAALTGIVRIAAGSFHSCAADDKGAVYCWGQNSVGQLGNGSTTAAYVATKVVFPTTTAVTRAGEVACGGGHTCVQTLDRGVWCWGSNLFGQVGDGTTTMRTQPVLVVAP